MLAPGLWMPASIMARLGARLAKAGYAPRVFAYRGRSPLEANVERLARFAREAFGDAAAHYVGFSLGGLLVLEMLNRHPEIPAASVVLLGAPVRGSLAGRRLGARRLGRWMLGASAPLWEERRARWTRATPLGVIAGTYPFGLGRMVGRLPDANDGVVRVVETGVDGMTAVALIKRAHSLLPLSGAVGALIEHFIARGRFA